MTTVDSGRRAEALAATELAKLGFKVLAMNWRTRFCEVDLIAERSGQIHFVEVKYRRRTDFGSGFDYITADKQARLRRAALAWMAQHAPKSGYQIDAVQVTGDLDHAKIDFLPNIVTEK